MYADDIQLYVRTKPLDIGPALTKLELCINAVSNWLSESFLSLNGRKTELIVLGTKPQLSKCGDMSLRIGGSDIKPSEVVHDLGVIIDKHMKLESNVNAICRTCFLYLRLIGRIRRSLTMKTCELLVRALVLSRIDYCATILYGISSRLITKLQRVFNASIRLVELLSKREHVKASLKRHKWIPVEDRIKMRVALLTFKTIHQIAPSYLSQLITPLEPNEEVSLRSHNHLRLAVARCKNNLGDRAFSNCAPTVWNNLPSNIRDSKKLITFQNEIERYFLDH
jgi:hypothetical protein